MDWLVGMLLLVAGAVIGYFVARYFNQDEQKTQNQAEHEQTIQQLMVQQATEHLHQSKKIAEEMTQKTAALNEQITNYEQLLIKQKSGAEDSQLNYFGEHASTYLRNKDKTPSREKSNADIQPLDFASESSGLFSGANGQDNKQQN